MTGLPARRIQLAASSKPEADWTARLAIGGAAAFTVLLASLGVVLYRSWPQVSGVGTSISTLSDRTERIANGQEMLSRDIASLRTDLRQDRADRTEGTREVAVLRARVGELAATVSTLRAQTDKLEAEGSQAKPVAAAPEPAAQPDPAVAELRARLDALQLKIDQLAAASAAPAPAVAVGPAPAPAPASVVVVKPVPGPAYPVDEVEREIRDMQAVIEAQRRAQSAAVRDAAMGGPVAVAAPRPSQPAATPRAVNGIADPLAPMVSKSQPRIAPTTRAGSATGPVVAPSVSRVPSEPSAQQTVSPAPRGSGSPDVRVSRVGVNTAMNAIGPLGLPFDAIGNLLTAIGEGLDTLFTGREYVPRTSPEDAPSTARAAR